MGRTFTILALAITAGMVLTVIVKKIADERREHDDADAISGRIDAKLDALEGSYSARAVIQS